MWEWFGGGEFVSLGDNDSYPDQTYIYTHEETSEYIKILSVILCRH
jgi:hypothetical protein